MYSFSKRMGYSGIYWRCCTLLAAILFGFFITRQGWQALEKGVWKVRYYGSLYSNLSDVNEVERFVFNKEAPFHPGLYNIFQAIMSITGPDTVIIYPPKDDERFPVFGNGGFLRYFLFPNRLVAGNFDLSENSFLKIKKTYHVQKVYVLVVRTLNKKPLWPSVAFSKEEVYGITSPRGAVVPLGKGYDPATFSFDFGVIEF